MQTHEKAEQTSADLSALRKQLQQTEHLLAVLEVVTSEPERRLPHLEASEALFHAANGMAVELGCSALTENQLVAADPRATAAGSSAYQRGIHATQSDSLEQSSAGFSHHELGAGYAGNHAEWTGLSITVAL